MTEKVVYTSMCLDHLHHGHLNIIKEAQKLGKVIIGIITDEAVTTYKRVPTIPFEKRLLIAQSLKGVWKVVPQYTLDYRPNLYKYKPNIVINGDDWKAGIQKETRQQVVNWLKENNGELVEIPYTKGVSSTQIIEDYIGRGITPDQRMCLLRRLINCKRIVRVLEAHNGLSALVVENTKHNGKTFDAIWESSLTDSSSKGKPDIELVDFTSRVQTIEEILEVTAKPIIVDGDTGGQIDHFRYMVRTLERLGVSAIIIEDKKFPKINSLMENAQHTQESMDLFCEKIEAGKKAQITEDFMIIARIESYILGKGVADAIARAKAYIKAGADGIMIHSKEKSPIQIAEFCREYKKLQKKVPLVAVPTTYNIIHEDELEKLGVSIVIYANHLLRSSYKAMKKVAQGILANGRSAGADEDCCSVGEIFDLTNR